MVYSLCCHTTKKTLQLSLVLVLGVTNALASLYRRQLTHKQLETHPWVHSQLFDYRCPGANAPGRRSPFCWMNIDCISCKKYYFYSGQLQKIKLLFEKNMQLFNSWYELPMGRSHVSQSKKRRNHQSCALLTLYVVLYYRPPVDSSHKRSIMRQAFPCHDISIRLSAFSLIWTGWLLSNSLYEWCQ